MVIFLTGMNKMSRVILIDHNSTNSTSHQKINDLISALIA